MPKIEEVKLTKSQVLVGRLCSSSFLYGILLLGLFGPGQISVLAFGFAIIISGLMAVSELYYMAEKCGQSPFKNVGLIFSGVLLGGVFWALAIKEDIALAQQLELLGLSFVVPIIGIAQLRSYSRGVASIAPLASTVFGIVYVVILLNLLQKIRYFPGDIQSGDGSWWLLFFILVSKMSDTGAYCTGQLIGKTKMIPRVSPGKTWEGFVGGIVFSVITACLFQQFAGDHFSPMPLIHALVLGILLGVGSVIGDLVESLIKREADVKDSGKFFPGIGGVLDLLDSLLFNAPIMYVYLKYILPS